MIGPFGHLGPLASGLVDDTLAPEERRRALEHLEHCADCDRLVAEQRRQRRLTATLGQVSVPTGLADRLLALGAAEGAGAAGGASVAPWSQTPDVRRRSAGRFVLVSAASVVGLGVVASGVLYGIGAPRVRTPEAIAQAAVSVDATSAVALSGATDSSADPGAAWPAGFSAPANLSASALTVTGTTASDTDAGDIVQVELDVDGETVTLLESHGTLDVDAGSVSRSVRVGDVEAHRVGQWWVAQAGTDVVAVRGSDDACLTVLRSFSTSTPTFPAAVLDRMGAGWRVVTGD